MPTDPGQNAVTAAVVRVLQIGRRGGDELAAIANWLAARRDAAAGGVSSAAGGVSPGGAAADGAAACIDLETIDVFELPARLRGVPADLVVVLLRWPDEVTAAETEALFGAWPIARVVCVCGAWCASIGRTRTIWPPATRVPAESALPRLERELAVLTGSRPPLSVTASAAECWLDSAMSPRLLSEQ